MTLVLATALRVSAPVLAGLLACVLLGRRSAALRHRVLAAALAAALAVIPLATVLPTWIAPFPTLGETIMPVRAAVAEPSSPAPGSGRAAASAVDAAPAMAAAASALIPFRARQLLVLVWLAGVAVGLGLLLTGLVRLVRLTRNAQPLVDGHWHRVAAEIAARDGVGRPIALRITRTADVLATWGVFTPRVLLPAQAPTWSEERARVALCHEVAHIRRGDWPVQMAAHLLRTVFWFNPLLWMLCARLRREGEQACDDAVLASGVPPALYASHLVAIARDCRRPVGWVPAMSIARPSTLEGRITAMLNTTLDREKPTRRVMALATILLAAVGLAAAATGASLQEAGPRSLTGAVYDTTGSVMPGVAVTLSDERQATASTTTDASGRFEFPAVGSGQYMLEIEVLGFKTLRNEFTLSAAGDWDRSITMQVGELEERISVRAKRPAQAARPVPSTGGPVRIGGNIKVPRKLQDVRPEYPAAMREAGLEGLVPMEALIDIDGRVASVRVLSAQVHPEFARAAEDAVRQWVFSPTLLNGLAVEVQMIVTVQFKLED